MDQRRHHGDAAPRRPSRVSTRPARHRRRGATLSGARLRGARSAARPPVARRARGSRSRHEPQPHAARRLERRPASVRVVHLGRDRHLLERRRLRRRPELPARRARALHRRSLPRRPAVPARPAHRRGVEPARLPARPQRLRGSVLTATALRRRSRRPRHVHRCHRLDVGDRVRRAPRRSGSPPAGDDVGPTSRSRTKRGPTSGRAWRASPPPSSSTRRRAPSRRSTPTIRAATTIATATTRCWSGASRRSAAARARKP